MLGVSVVICCHNSAHLLSQTLNQLSAQQLSENLPCEVILVDNISTDNTVNIAKMYWPSTSSIPLYILHEPQLGLSYARRRGISAAKYEVVSLIDDDNRVMPDWCQLAYEVMSQHPDIGACGGYNEPVLDTDPPLWFDKFKNNYAIGAQSQEAGYVSEDRGYLWGAGLTIRKSAWDMLISNGFQSRLLDRQGTSLSSGNDGEICLALQLAGWRLWYDPRLRLQHYLLSDRLEWTYLRRLVNGFGAASVNLEPYEIALKNGQKGLIGRMKDTWLWKTLATAKALCRKPVKLLLAGFFKYEGDKDILVIESHWGRLKMLVRQRSIYSIILREIQNAKWRVNT